MVRKKNNTVLVREYIRNLILQKGLKAGDMLPCEGEIAEELTISKSCVREATHALESLGMIEIRHGIGLFLRDFNLDAVNDIFDYGFVLNPTIVLDLYDLRKLIETALMPRVVERIGEKEIHNCEEVLKEWEIVAETGKPSYEIDGRFHDALYSVVDNRMLTTLCHIFWTAYCDLEMNQRLGDVKAKDKENTFRIIKAHREILTAVRHHDTQLATELMMKHFVGIEKPNY